MESIGDKIRKVREEKGYSLDQVARDTHITRRFLEALEVENFSSMPGESYVIGFLRSYTEYLGMNPEEIVSLYKNLKLQEQPAPMNELLERPRMPRSTLIGIICIVIVAISGGVYLVLSGNSSNTVESTQALAPKVETDPKSFQNDVLERSFESGESIRIPVNGVDMDLQVGIKEGTVQLAVNGTTLALPAQKESLLDLNQDGKMDLKVTVRDIDTKSNPNKVILRLDRVVQSPQSIAQTNAALLPETAANSGLVPAGMSNQPSRIKQALPIAEYTDLQNIILNIRFDGSCVFRYETNDGKREERMMGAGDSMNISATGFIRLWIANGGKTTLKIGSREIKAGSEGEVVAYTLDWATVGTNRQLELAPLY